MNSAFEQKLIGAIHEKIPFALIRKPDEERVFLFVNQNKGAHRLLMHSFDSKLEKYIQTDELQSISVADFNFDFELDLPTTNQIANQSQSEYEHLIQKTIDDIRNSDLLKVVMSRQNRIENKAYHLLKSYKNLLLQHPSALVFLWHWPDAETWMGATPELLLSQVGNQVNTVSLAGTKRPEVEWTPKEIEEQQIVTDFILDGFSSVQKVKTRGPETIQAGKFQHLKTYISGEIYSDFPIADLLAKLHPTPALCGMPKQASFEYIVQNEAYPREFYAGYIGLENPDSKTYFVNLRSAQFYKNQIHLYVGGGITADSQADKEWQETELKSSTILNALKS